MEKAGFTVLRFSDEEVLKVINNVTRTLEGWIEESEMKIHPQPPPAGDRR
ncbi:MAG: hypothetical protein JXB00_02345 [Bacteroidales bacterium]|nr:hypothetical protein [Bacteroidales bacterium]